MKDHRDHKGMQFRSLNAMLDYWGITGYAYRKQISEGVELRTILEANTAEVLDGGLFARQSEYTNIDELIEAVYYKGKIYNLLGKNSPLEFIINEGLLCYLLARAFGYVVNIDEGVTALNDTETVLSISLEYVLSAIPDEIVSLLAWVQPLDIVIDNYRKGADVYKSFFTPRTHSPNVSSAYRFTLGQYYFRNRLSLLMFLSNLGIKTRFVTTDVYASDGRQQLVFMDTNNATVSYIRDMDAQEVLSNLSGASDELKIGDTTDNEKSYSNKADTNAVLEEKVSDCNKTEKEFDDTEEIFDNMEVVPDEDEHIEDYVDSPKYYFVDVDGETILTSLEDFEKLHDIRADLVYARISEGYVLSEAITKGYFANSSDDGRYDFPDGIELYDVRFKTLLEICNAVNIPCSVVLTRLRRGTYSTYLDALLAPTADRDVCSMLFKLFYEQERGVNK